MAKVPHEPTDEIRLEVKNLCLIGTPKAKIAEILGMHQETLSKYYRAELEYGSTRATASIGGALYRKAMGGDTAAMIFWMKTRAGWREKPRDDDTPTTPTPISITIQPIAAGTYLPGDDPSEK